MPGPGIICSTPGCQGPATILSPAAISRQGNYVTSVARTWHQLFNSLLPGPGNNFIFCCHVPAWKLCNLCCQDLASFVQLLVTRSRQGFKILSLAAMSRQGNYVTSLLPGPGNNFIFCFHFRQGNYVTSVASSGEKLFNHCTVKYVPKSVLYPAAWSWKGLLTRILVMIFLTSFAVFRQGY